MNDQAPLTPAEQIAALDAVERLLEEALGRLDALDEKLIVAAQIDLALHALRGEREILSLRHSAG